MTPAQVAASLDAWESGYVPDPDPWAARRQEWLAETYGDTIQSETTEAAGCGNTQRPLATPSEPSGSEDTMSVPPTPLEKAQRKAVAIEFLMLHQAERVRLQEELEKNKRRTAYFVVNARKYGVTNQEIADVLGVTEGAVRSITKRAAQTDVAA